LKHYDNIIIGAGHNGLVCASYLARSGQSVLVLEATGKTGGLAAAREFHPGFTANVAHSLSHFSATIARELDLTRHGYTQPGKTLQTIALDQNGQHVSIQADSVSGVSDKDVQKYADYLRLLSRCAAALAPSWLKTIPRIGNNSLKELLSFAHVGIKLRLLGKDDMREFLRIAALPARDLMDEHFDNDLLKAALAWDSLIGSTQAPRSPNNTVLTLLYRMAGDTGGQHCQPAGGVDALVNALEASATSSGAEIRCNSPVKRIVLSGSETGLQVTGVELDDGDIINAARVVSGADPKQTFMELVGAENLEIGFTNRIHRLRSRGFVAKLHLALNGAPEFPGVDCANARMIIAPTMDSIEFAWDDAKYGQCPEQPVMEVLVPSINNPAMAPADQHVLSAHVMYIPYAPEGGWTTELRDKLTRQLIDMLCQYAPALREQILHAQLLTPADLEADWHVSGGHWHHGELAMDQMLMMRPTYQAAQYATPIAGLYLCSAGCHPGGDLVGAAGHNAAREMLK